MTKPCGIVIHGGAGTILQSKMTPEKEACIRETLTEALYVGIAVLQKGHGALGAVQKAVNVMENSPLFNAGRGAVFTHDGINEQDATIMDGFTGKAGAVAGVRRIANPIDLAKQVMCHSPHVLLMGEGAEQFAVEQGFKLVDKDYFYTDQRWEQLQALLAKEQAAGENKKGGLPLALSEDDKHGTVGAVALDKMGGLAAATSSGGMTNKRYGRVGDSSCVGAGTYADKLCAVSTTGHGEFFMRGVVAYDIAARMRYGGMSLSQAAEASVQTSLTDREGTGGLIAIDKDGNFALPFNTEGMYRGHLMQGTEPVVKIFRE
ncbi:MAG: isoaspartyl peptidase/L-asparaginase [candidate division Zixibacteria bacterium]|nr:isoaspartyl peptidase/L-asparaginase [candidate division Zixibacteria bacterium]MDH3936383.1 isoaspartyl peptidase/L-asparaginase [candidate division Zixibacteria bacterium]MDH4032214.1 isoaspartyl peptidase/L-asparaginase [candidate division Zixibacteria bacterium]